MVTVDQFAFERGKEALAQGIVIGVADGTHRRTHTCLPAAPTELEGSVLAAPGRSGGSPPTDIVAGWPCPGHPGRVRSADTIRHRPTDHTSNSRHRRRRPDTETGPGRDIGDVGDPELVRSVHREVPIDQVRRRPLRRFTHGGGRPLAPTQPAEPAIRIRRATRLRPTYVPSSASSACIRGAP